MEQAKTTIAVNTVIVTTGGGLFSPPNRYTFLRTATLIDSLHAIKSLSYEEHTKSNIQKLIDMILSAHTTA